MDETNAKVEGSCCLELDFLPEEVVLPPSILTRLQLKLPLSTKEYLLLLRTLGG